MDPQDFAEVVSRLSPEEQSAVEEFIAFLREGKGKPTASAFAKAVEEFIVVHPELLRRLAQ